MVTDTNAKKYRAHMKAAVNLINDYFYSLSDDRLNNYSDVKKVIDKARRELDLLEGTHVALFKK